MTNGSDRPTPTPEVEDFPSEFELKPRSLGPDFTVIRGEGVAPKPSTSDHLKPVPELPPRNPGLDELLIGFLNDDTDDEKPPRLVGNNPFVIPPPLNSPRDEPRAQSLPRPEEDVPRRAKPRSDSTAIGAVRLESSSDIVVPRPLFTESAEPTAAIKARYEKLVGGSFRKVLAKTEFERVKAEDQMVILTHEGKLVDILVLAAPEDNGAGTMSAKITCVIHDPKSKETFPRAQMGRLICRYPTNNDEYSKIGPAGVFSITLPPKDDKDLTLPSMLINADEFYVHNHESRRIHHKRQARRRPVSGKKLEWPKPRGAQHGQPVKPKWWHRFLPKGNK